MVATQIGFLCGIMAGFWLTGLLLGIVITRASAVMGNNGTVPLLNAFHVKPMYVSLLVLAAVLFAVRIINLVLDTRVPQKAE